MGGFCISEVPAGGGTLAIASMPGRFVPFAEDMKTLLGWRPDMVLSMAEAVEMARLSGADIGVALRQAGVIWHHLPVCDFGAPHKNIQQIWPAISTEARAVLAKGGRVLAHCAGGCGRSGMAALRLMVEGGEDPEAALTRLRGVRACAVETEAQRFWAQVKAV